MIRTLVYIVQTVPYNSLKVMLGSIITIVESMACLATLGFLQPTFTLTYYLKVMEWEECICRRTNV